MQHMQHIIDMVNHAVAVLRRGDEDVVDDAGNQLVEYLLLCALIAIVCMLAVTFLGNSTSSSFSSLGGSLGA